MTLKAALAAALIALSFSFPALADTLAKDSPFLETDAAGRSTMP